MLAALASAAMPSIVMAGVRDSERANDTDDAAGIDQAVMQDAAGRMYDIYACDTENGRKRLTGRVQAAKTLERAMIRAVSDSPWIRCLHSLTARRKARSPAARP